MYTLAMSLEELAALEQNITAELGAMQAERNLDFQDADESEAIGKDMAALEAELALVKAEKRRREQRAAIQPENPGIKEIAELKTEIAAVQEKKLRLTVEVGLAQRGGVVNLHKVTRLAGQIKVLNRNKRRLKLTLRRREMEQRSLRNSTNEDIWLRKERISLETQLGRCGESSLEDFIEDSRGESQGDGLVDSTTRDESAGILHTLSPLAAKVLRMRFGIGYERAHTLEEIGLKFDLTRERIRQIEVTALRQLRAPQRGRRLRALIAGR
jgi:hypothetical protein